METSVSLLERLAGAPTDDDWRRLLDLYQPLLRAWMTRAGVAAADVADLSQEVLLVVFREVGGFERRGEGAFRAWLRTILMHRVRDYFRARQHRPAAAGGSDFLKLFDELESPESALSRHGTANTMKPSRRRCCAASKAISPRPPGKRFAGTSSKASRRTTSPRNWACR